VSVIDDGKTVETNIKLHLKKISNFDRYTYGYMHMLDIKQVIT